MTAQDRHELIKDACEDCRKGILSKDATLNIVEWLASEQRPISDNTRVWAIQLGEEQRKKIADLRFPHLGLNNLG